MMAGSIALACANAGAAVGWGVPTYKNARPVWRFAMQTVQTIADSGMVRVRNSDQVIEFPSGGWLALYTATNDTAIRGEAFDLFVGDEAARFDESTYTDVIVPTVADRNGTVLLLSTPWGLNWFHREWLVGQDPANWGFQKSWQRPTYANPIPSIRHAADIAAKALPFRTYQQEWLAQFIEDLAQVFRYVDEAAWIDSTDEMGNPIRTQLVVPQDYALPGHTYVIGVDWGRDVDYTVIAVMDATLKELVFVDRFNQIDFRQQIGRLWGVCQRFRPQTLVVEENSIGVPLIEQLQRLDLPVVPFMTTNASKAHLIDRLALALEHRMVRVLPVVCDELKAYSSFRTPSGMMKYGAPEGMHDDMAMALLLAWHAVSAPQLDVLDRDLQTLLSEGLRGAEGPAPRNPYLGDVW